MSTKHSGGRRRWHIIFEHAADKLFLEDSVGPEKDL